jgi:Zn-dependent protease with chaperone function
MTFVRRSLLALCLSLLVTGLVPHFSAGQATSPKPATAPSAASTAAPQPAVAPIPAAPQQAYSLPPEKLAKAIALSRIRHIMGFAGTLWGLAVLWILLATHFFSCTAAWAGRIIKWRWLSGLLFFAIFFVITTLASLPLDLYSQHVEIGYGISVQSWASWAGDQGKALGLGVLIGAPVLLLFNWIVKRWPRRFWLGLWIATVPLMALGIFVSPLLEPIFNKYEPLAKNNPTLVTDLEKVVARTGTNIPPERMYLMKASLKTNGLNAYVSGMGATKRVVVWDTTAGRVPNDDVLFVFGHESGHYVLHHMPKILAGSAVFLFFLYWGCAAFANWMVRRFGARWHAETLASRTGFVVLLFAISIASFFLQPINSAFSRHFEHEADIYGQEAIHGLVADPQKTAVASFNALGEAWLEDPNPSPFIEFWTYGHPSVQNRANFALHYDPWVDGGHGKFFDK